MKAKHSQAKTSKNMICLGSLIRGKPILAKASNCRSALIEVEWHLYIM